ncbi:AAA-like domain-containing protein [Kamptonema sp. UHCC 0994]|uniref:AAA-like domain-containing protein n=1 Tax=Kamptonema sp. UHCC 0994 TaxID=3031329 RepID=UPI0023B8B888|nr:AAA-like domain-containing protein [Kamptonema sp. UHCC 0994]MDF0553029.1 AAA-like domain-containing protein [Kamptonema sp. UHCC 0994]
MNSESQFTWDEALKVADAAIYEKTGSHLSDIEVKVLRGAWDGDSYEQIAEKFGYSVNYIRADIGSKLWEKLSKALPEEVTKKKFQEALKRESERRKHRPNSPPPLEEPLEYPDGQVPLNSRFYVERQPIESDCYKEILKAGSLIRIKAPNQMGKTSLMVRILAHAETYGYRTVRLNLQQAEATVFTNLDKLLRWLCANISRQLGLQPMLDDYWDEEIGSKISCTTYFQAHLLEKIDSPLVVAFDEVDRVFHYPDIAGDFLPLLREFHEEANNLEIWRRLRLVVTHSTEVYIPLNINRSPFNVGLPIKLPEFTEKQVQELANLHKLDLKSEEVKQLMAIVGGHPFLVRLAFYHLQREDINLENLLSEAATQAGIYSDHLRRHLGYFQKQPELIAAMKRVVESDKSVQLESRQAYKLESMGLVKLKGDEVISSCELYRRYFCDRL